MPIIGNGSDKKHLHVHITSRHLMNNLSMKGVHHIDATYKITTYGFPLIVFGVSDAVGKFHPVSFMITSHETQHNFEEFYDVLLKYIRLISVVGDLCLSNQRLIYKLILTLYHYIF